MRAPAHPPTDTVVSRDELAASAPNVVLTGFMGTGKTTIGRLLAARLDRPFVDTDDIIAERHGPVPEIFEQRGEDAFRRLEQEVARGLAEQSGLVISTGGAMLLDPVNVASLGRSGIVFCLTAAPEVILGRLRRGRLEDRPLLAGPDPLRRIEELLEQRRSGYEAFTQVPTERRSPGAIVEDLVAKIEAAPSRI